MHPVMNWAAFISLMGVGLWSIPTLFQSMPFSSSAPALSSYSYGATELELPIPYHKPIQEYWDRIKKLTHIDQMIKMLGQQILGSKLGKGALEAGKKARSKVEGEINKGKEAIKSTVSDNVNKVKATVTTGVSAGVDKMKAAVPSPAGAAAGALNQVKSAIPPPPAIPNPLPNVPNPLPNVQNPLPKVKNPFKH